MSEKSKQISWVAVVGTLGIAAVLAMNVQDRQQNNQFVQPLPNVGPQPPLVQELPGLVAHLRGTKVACEDAVIAAKRHLGNQVRQRTLLARGEGLYVDVRKTQAACIAYLSSAATRRFAESDRAEIGDRLRVHRSATEAFRNWAEQTAGNVRSFGAGPVDSLADAVSDWLVGSDKANSEALRQFREELGKCELRSWDDLEPLRN